MAESPRSINFLAQIEQSPSKGYLLNSLRQQLAKDLALEITAIPESGLLVWLKSWLDQHLSDLDLGQLLYTIDLTEKGYETSYKLAKAILEREAQKVIFRAQYSGKL